MIKIFNNSKSMNIDNYFIDSGFSFIRKDLLNNAKIKELIANETILIDNPHDKYNIILAIDKLEKLYAEEIKRLAIQDESNIDYTKFELIKIAREVNAFFNLKSLLAQTCFKENSNYYKRIKKLETFINKLIEKSDAQPNNYHGMICEAHDKNLAWRIGRRIDNNIPDVRYKSGKGNQTSWPSRYWGI